MLSVWASLRVSLSVSERLCASLNISLGISLTVLGSLWASLRVYLGVSARLGASLRVFLCISERLLLLVVTSGRLSERVWSSEESSWPSLGVSLRVSGRRN